MQNIPEKRLRILLLSVFCAYFNIMFITPFLSLDILTGYGHNSLFFACLVFCMPNIAQVLTLKPFSKLAETKNWVKPLVIFGYTANLIGVVALYFVTTYLRDALVVLLVTFMTNLFVVAFMPSIKAFFGHLNPGHQGARLSQVGLIFTATYGLGSIAGGILYEFVSLEFMLLLGLLFAVLALILMGFMPTMTIPQNNTPNMQLEPYTALDPSSQLTTAENPQPSSKSSLSFQEALGFQFGLRAVASVFSGILGPYLLLLGAGSTYIGAINAAAAVLGAFSIVISGKYLDRRGPDGLYWYAWISYVIVFLGFLLTTNLIWLFIIWAWPAYTFYLATEYIACHQPDQQRGIQDMARANFSMQIALVAGQILGGLIATWVSYRAVLWVGLVGCTMAGIWLIIHSKYIQKNKELI